MDQSIDGRRGHYGIWKNLAPSGKWLIGGDGDAAAFVSMRDEFEPCLSG
jgi:hypothetical protein